VIVSSLLKDDWERSPLAAEPVEVIGEPPPLFVCAPGAAAIPS
jgi:hypothetical protein